jgi:hypothetical protein
MSVALPNARASVYRSDNTTLVVTEGRVNFQIAGARFIQAMAQARGDDYSNKYRCRVDQKNLVAGLYPQQGDIIFLTEFTQQPDLVGRWVVDETEVYTGPLKSRLLYCSREIINGLS